MRRSAAGCPWESLPHSPNPWQIVPAFVIGVGEGPCRSCPPVPATTAVLTHVPMHLPSVSARCQPAPSQPAARREERLGVRRALTWYRSGWTRGCDTAWEKIGDFPFAWVWWPSASSDGRRRRTRNSQIPPGFGPLSSGSWKTALSSLSRAACSSPSGQPPAQPHPRCPLGKTPAAFLPSAEEAGMEGPRSPVAEAREGPVGRGSPLQPPLCSRHTRPL